MHFRSGCETISQSFYLLTSLLFNFVTPRHFPALMYVLAMGSLNCYLEGRDLDLKSCFIHVYFDLSTCFSWFECASQSILWPLYQRSLFPAIPICVETQ